MILVDEIVNSSLPPKPSNEAKELLAYQLDLPETRPPRGATVLAILLLLADIPLLLAGSLGLLWAGRVMFKRGEPEALAAALVFVPPMFAIFSSKVPVATWLLARSPRARDRSVMWLMVAGGIDVLVIGLALLLFELRRFAFGYFVAAFDIVMFTAGYAVLDFALAFAAAIFIRNAR